MFGHGFDKLVYALLCGGDTKFKLPKAGNGNVLRSIFFYTWVRFAREGKAVALQYHEQGSTDTNVCGGFAVGRALSVDEHKHSPARIRYSNKVLYTMFRTTHRLCTDVLSFIGCQTSTNFKLASLGMRGAQERTLLVPDDNVGTYGSCAIIKMKTTVVVVLNKYRLVYNSIFL